MNKKLKSNLSTFEKDLKSMQLILEEIESKDLSLEEVIDKYKLGCQKLAIDYNRKNIAINMLNIIKKTKNGI